MKQCRDCGSVKLTYWGSDPYGYARCGECNWRGVPDHTPETMQNISLRDYFAGQALAMQLEPGEVVTDEAKCATWCFEMADAMMEARKKDVPGVPEPPPSADQPERAL